MISGGWVLERNLSEAEHKAVRNALNNSGSARFHDPEAQEVFLQHVEASLKWYETVEIGGNVPEIRDAFAEAAKAAEKFEKSLAHIGDEKTTFLDLLAQRVGKTNMRTLAREISIAAQNDVDSLRPDRPGPNSPSKVYALVKRLAEAWKLAFGRKPGSGRDGPFARTVNALLIAINEQPIGESALKTILATV